MTNQVGDIIVINNVKYIVLTNFNDNNINYAFVNEVTDDESDITQNYYLVIVNADGTYTRVTDENEINRLFPKVQEGLKQSMTEFGIDYKSITGE